MTGKNHTYHTCTAWLAFLPRSFAEDSSSASTSRTANKILLILVGVIRALSMFRGDEDGSKGDAGDDLNPTSGAQDVPGRSRLVMAEAWYPRAGKGVTKAGK